MSRSYTSSPPSAFMACSGTALAFSFLYEYRIILSITTIIIKLSGRNRFNDEWSCFGY
jgi:hypothetical protein